MKSKKQGGHVFCWILAIAITILFSHLIQCQPNNYFKGSQITQLPSKALPRIGRRSGADVDGETVAPIENENSENSEIPYSFKYPPTNSYSPETYSRMFMDLAEENLLEANPNLIFLLKRISTKDKVLRNEEPIGIIRDRNDK